MKHLLLALITVTTIALTSSCQNKAEKAAEKQIEKATGEKADVELSDDKFKIETGDGTISADATATSWPGDIPSSVPEFKYGKVDYVSQNDIGGQKTWTIHFVNVKNDALKKYEADLKDKGLKIIVTQTMENWGNVTAEKGSLMVNAMTESNEATVMVNIGE